MVKVGARKVKSGRYFIRNGKVFTKNGKIAGAAKNILKNFAKKY